METKLPKWLNQVFIVPTAELSIYQLPIDPFIEQPETEVSCRVWGEDGTLHVYQIEITSGRFDGSKFFAGRPWVEKYIEL